MNPGPSGGRVAGRRRLSEATAAGLSRRLRGGAMAAALALATAGAAEAQARLPQVSAPEVAFRSVTPPTGGTRKRIIFQEQSLDAPIRATGRGFWTRPEARPQLTPGRPLGPALEAAAAWARTTGRSPEQDRTTARRIMAAHGPAMLAAAQGSGLSLSLLLAVAIAESGGDSGAVSPKGARGLMQLMPATAADLGVADAFSPAEAAPGAARHLSGLLRRFDEDPLAAIAAYNAGAAAVEARRGVPPWAETRAYVPRVLSAAAALQELCLVPPTGPRAPCAPTPSLHRPAPGAPAPSARGARPGWIAAPR